MPYVKGGNAAALPKFSDMLTLSQSEGADYAHPLALPRPNFFLDYAHVTFRYPITFPHSILHPRACIKICVHTKVHSFIKQCLYVLQLNLVTISLNLSSQT